MVNAVKIRGPLLALSASVFFYSMADMMAIVGIPLLVLNGGYGAGGVGAVLAARVIPNVLLGGLVGATVERINAKLTVATTAVLASILFMCFSVASEIWELITLAGAVGIVTMFGAPAQMVLRFRVVPRGNELRGNGAIVVAERLPAVLGPALAGSIIGFMGPDAVFLPTGTAAVCAAVVLLGVPEAPRPNSGPPAEWPSWISMLFGAPLRLVKILRQDSLLWVLTLTSFTYVFSVAVGRVFLSEFSVTQFADVPGAFGYLMAAMGIGGAVGGAAMFVMGRIPIGPTYLVASVCEALCWVVVPIVSSLLVESALLFVAGMFEGLATIVFFSQTQVRLDSERSGLYFALLLPLTDLWFLGGSVVGAAIMNLGHDVTAIVIAATVALPVLACGRILLRRRARDDVNDATLSAL